MAEWPKISQQELEENRRKREALAAEVMRTQQPAVKPDMVSRWLGVKDKPAVGYSGPAPYAGQPSVAQYGADQSYGMPWAPYQEGTTRATMAQHAPVHMTRKADEMALTEDRRPSSAPDGTPLPTPQYPDWMGYKDNPQGHYDQMVQTGLYNANRSAVASLGLRDMTKFNIDPREDAARMMPWAGTYISHVMPGGGLELPPGAELTEDALSVRLEDGTIVPLEAYDRGTVNRASERPGAEGMQSGATLPHEGMHRGIEILRNTGKYAEATRRMFPKGQNEEPAIRTIMASLLGKTNTKHDQGMGGQTDEDMRALIIGAHEDPSSVGLHKKESGAWTYKPSAYMDWHHKRAALEFLAAELIKDKQPGGPR